MLTFLIKLCLLALLLFGIHEVGHEVAARLVGRRLKWYWYKFRLCWTAIDADKWTKRERAIVGLAGFASEIAAGVLLSFLSLHLAIYIIPIIVIHIVAYRFYADPDHNDFVFIKGK